MNRPKIDLTLVSLIFLATFLRVINLKQQLPYCDEGFHRASAEPFIKTGSIAYTHWHHPPLKYYFFYLSQRLFGDTFFAGRVVSVIFGVLIVVLSYILIKMITESQETAILGALFITIEPFHIAYSRVGIEETQQAFWMLVSLIFCLRSIRTLSSLDYFLTGISLGMLLSTKLQGTLLIPAFIISFILFNLVNRKQLDLPALFLFITNIILLPISVYLLVYIPWFSQGQSVSDFLAFQKQAFLSLTSVSGYLVNVSTKRAILWFLAPSFHFMGTSTTPSNTAFYVIALTNPLLWLLTIPAVFYAAGRAKKNYKKYVKHAIVLLVFFSLYLPLVLTNRAIYPYSAMILFPLICLLISDFLLSTFQSNKMFSRYLTSYIAVYLLLCVITYPLTIGIEIPQSASHLVTALLAALKF